MLPILRILPLGGFLLALVILALALVPPGRFHRDAIAYSVITARGSLIDRDDHPEWRQFLIRAALRRADELVRLRDVADIPVHSGSILPAHNPVLLNQPVADLPAEISPKATSLNEPAVKGVNSTTTSHEISGISPANTVVDTSQVADAAGTVNQTPKQRSLTRRGIRYAKPQPTQVPAQPNLFGKLFSEASTAAPHPIPITRQPSIRRRQLKPTHSPAQTTSQEATRPAITEANKEVSGNTAVTETNNTLKPTATRARRVKNAKKTSRQPSANPSPLKNRREVNDGSG